MDQNKEKIRYTLQYHFDKGDDASQACEKDFGVYGEGALLKSAARKWFARFHSRNFDVCYVMLCVWWDWKRIVHNELLSLGQTINPVVYCEQLEILRPVMPDWGTNPAKGLFFARFEYIRDSPTPRQSGNTDYAKRLREHGQNWSIRRVSSFTTTTLDHTHLWWLAKN